MSILFKEYTDEEANALFYEDGREAGYDDGFGDGYSKGAAAQRAKDEAELKILKDKQVSNEAEIAQLKAEIEKLRSKEL